MSDPVTNIEIEDVLSSIRRLVSEDTRFDRGPAPETESKKPAKLVLTPAQRVPEQNAEVDDTEAGDGYALAADDLNEAPWRDPDATLYDAASVTTEDESYAEESSEEEVTLDEDLSLDDWDPSEDASTAHVYTLQDMIVDDQAALSDDEEDIDADVEVDEVEVEEVEFADEQSAPESLEYLNDDASENDIIEHADVVEYDDEDIDEYEDHDEFEEHDDLEVQDDLEEQVGETPQDAPLQDTSHSERVAALSDKIKALESAIGRSHDQWESDGTDDSEDFEAPTARAMPWSDHSAAEADVDAKEPDAENVDVIAADEAVLDEEMLRELVSDIVREELQGALGERITRNVRKLVRREIHRALTAQELD